MNPNAPKMVDNNSMDDYTCYFRKESMQSSPLRLSVQGLKILRASLPLE
jgi:hypothetical protein